MLNATIPFLLLPILTRVLSPADYGRVGMLEALIACFAAFTGLSAHGAIGVRYFHDNRSTFTEYVGTCFYLLFGSTALVALFVLGCQSLGIRLAAIEPHWTFFAVLVSLSQFLINVRLVIWQSAEQPLRYGSFQALQSLLNGLITLALVVPLALGGTGRMLGLGLSAIITGCLAIVSLQSDRWITWKWNPEFFYDAMRFGLPLVPHTLGALAISSADRFVISERLGVDNTGVYFAAVQLAAPMLMLGSGFNRAFVPWLFARLTNGENTKAVTASYLAILGFLIAGCGYGLFLSLGLFLIVGEEYRASQPVALILVAGTTFQAAYYAVVNYLFFAKRTVHLATVTFTAGVLYAAGAWLIAPRYGLSGIAAWFSTVQLVVFLAIWLIGLKVCPQPWAAISAVRAELLKFARSTRSSQ